MRWRRSPHSQSDGGVVSRRHAGRTLGTRRLRGSICDVIGTDVLIDVALDRKPHSESACELLDRLELRPGSAFIAWHTASNFYYLVSSKRGAADTRRFVLELLGYVGVASVNTAALRFAAELPMSDFEDAMQVAAAQACNARHIVTRNVRDYRLSPIPAITPQQAISDLF